MHVKKLMTVAGLACSFTGLIPAGDGHELLDVHECLLGSMKFLAVERGI